MQIEVEIKELTLVQEECHMVNISNFNFLGLDIQEGSKFSRVREKVVEVRDIHLDDWVWFRTLMVKPKQNDQIIQGDCKSTKWKNKNVQRRRPEVTSDSE